MCQGHYPSPGWDISLPNGTRDFNLGVKPWDWFSRMAMRSEAKSPKVFAGHQPHLLLQLLPGIFTHDDLQKLSDLRGDLRG